MIQKTACLLVVSFLIVGDGLAQEPPDPAPTEDIFDRVAKKWKRDRFKLFNRCKPMGLTVELTVEDLSPDATKIGLTKESIQAAVESRLRSARLYDSEAAGTADTDLYVNVMVLSSAFFVELKYRKPFHDLLSNQSGWATTWHDGALGTHGKNAGYILSAIAKYMDRFLVEFLRVNEKACAESSK